MNVIEQITFELKDLRFRLHRLAVHIGFWTWAATHAPMVKNYDGEYYSLFTHLQLTFFRPYFELMVDEGVFSVYINLHIFTKSIYSYPPELAESCCKQHNISFYKFFDRYGGF